MKDRRCPFFAFRYMVTPASDQITIIQQMNKSKEELMIDLIKDLTNTPKSEWIKGNKRYLFYGWQSKEDVYIIKFARETNEKVYLEGEDDIEIKGIKEAKYVYLIVDTKNQIILLERNTSVFSSIENCIGVFAEFLRENMIQYDYIANVYPLVSKRKFWNYVETAEEIYELSLVMNAPNMAWFGHEDTRDILKEIKETTNNEEFDITFKNKEGKLKVAKNALGGWIEYIREVGGKYSLKFSSNGIQQTKTSETDTARTYIDRKKHEQYSDEELDDIRIKLELIHKIENRDEAEQ